MTTRVYRLSAATLLIVAAAATIMPHTTSYVSSSAVVNAPIISIKAPFDGHVADASAAIAEPVVAGSTPLLLEAERESESRLASLRAEAMIVSSKIKAIDAHIAELQEIEERLETRVDAHMAKAGRWIRSHLEEVRANAKGVEARRDLLVRELARVESLAQTGTASGSHLDNKAAELAVLESELAQQRARETTLSIEAEALSDGTALDARGDESSYARQRLDEIALRRAELMRERMVLGTQQSALIEHLAHTEEELEARKGFAPSVSAGSVVWEASPPVGAPVGAGDEVMRLVNCERRFVEVVLAEKHFEKIEPGQSATILLKGAKTRFVGQVEAVRGAGARFGTPALAAAPVNVNMEELSVVVRLEPSDVTDPRVASAFCDVGRTAEVRNDRPGVGEGQWLVALRAKVFDMASAVSDALDTWIAALHGSEADRPAVG